MKSELLDKVLEWRDVVVIDFENYQCIPTDLLNEEYVYYLFCGATTTKCANAYKEMLNAYDVNVIETKHTGTNFVDNRISMYIGYIYLESTVQDKLYLYPMILIIMKCTWI